MSTKTRVLNVRVVGFSAPERQMLNSIFLLSVAPARQIGYKLWNPEAGVAPDMYLLDGDSESAVASWQATFASTSDRTLVVGAKNLDLGVASASRPLGLKVVGAMDRLAIALKNVQETAAHDVSSPAAGASLPTNPSATSSTPKPDLAPKADVTLKPEKQEQTLTRATTGMTSQQPALSASMNAIPPMSAAAQTLAGSTLSSAAAAATSAHATTMSATHVAAQASALPAAMTAAAPAATVLPSMTLQPNVALDVKLGDKPFEKSLNEKPVTEKTVDKILSDKLPAEKPAVPVANLQASGVTPLSPSALSAAVAPSSTRTNLRVVPNPVTAQPPPSTPLAASLPAAARIADAPMQATPPATPKIADARGIL